MSKRKTHEEFVEEMKFKNPNIEVLGEYTGVKNKILVKCKKCGNEWYTNAGHILEGRRCKKCGIISRTKTHEQFILEMSILHPNILVLGEYINCDTKILVKCKIDGYEWMVTPSNLLTGQGCPCCSNKVCVKGINDLSTTEPWIIPLLNDKDDAYKYTRGSTRKIYFKCPICGKLKLAIIENIVNRKRIHCDFCSDGISYPNKFGRIFLSQVLMDNFIPEWNEPDWVKPYRYDNYFVYKGKEYILEMDGEVHIKGWKNNPESLNKTKEIDKIKDDLAIKHNIILIRIDCRESSMEYIKNSILNNKILSELFDLSKIDWIKCDKLARCSLVKEVCDYYMNYDDVIIHIADHFKLHRRTIRQYLKNGSKIGLCDYPHEKLKIFNTYDINGEVICENKNIVETTKILESKNIKMNSVSKIYDVLNGKIKSYKGMIFKYPELA